MSNGRAGVFASTRQRVEDVLRGHGHPRNASGPPTPFIELVFQALDSQWALEIIRGAEQAARPHGLNVAITEMQGRLTPDSGWVRQVLLRRPVGIIGVSAQLTPDQHAQVSRRNIPLVTLDPSGEPTGHGATVGATNVNGGRTAARHLLQLGHRRIAMISGPDAFACCRDRSDGYRAALEAAGVPPRPELLRVAPLYAESGLAHARALLRLRNPPTAVFAGNDLQALGVYEAARELRLRIPEDLSVVGFDDLAFVRWVSPPLTTVRQPLLQMGATAADLILQLAAGRPLATERVELPTSLIVRRSTAPPNST